MPRTTTGSFRVPFDTAIGNTMSSDPYTAILFSQDPLFGMCIYLKITYKY